MRHDPFHALHGLHLRNGLRAMLHGSEDLAWFVAILIPLLIVSLLIAGHPGEWQP